jgi:hypothetical protein
VAASNKEMNHNIMTEVTETLPLRRTIPPHRNSLRASASIAKVSAILTSFAYFSPHGLHSVCSPLGPLRHQVLRRTLQDSHFPVSFVGGAGFSGWMWDGGRCVCF